MITATQQHGLVDALGIHHEPTTTAARIVCLVPSITELLFALGLGEQIVGRTHYCIHPADQVPAVPSVGGTKKIKQKLLKSLNPTHVIVNIDENPKAMAEQLATFVPHLIVTHPQKPRDNLALYRLLGGIFRREAEGEALCRRFETALNTLQEATHGWPRQKVLYLIWRKPWMTVARDTYISRTLELAGWDTLPAVAEQRYPVVEISQALLAETDLLLFSTEPYRFKPQDLADFSRLYSCPPATLWRIDGEMTSWYGSRAIAGLEYLYRFALAWRYSANERLKHGVGQS